MNNRNLELLATLLDYPRHDYHQLVESCYAVVAADLDEEETAMQMWLQSFRSNIVGRTMEEVEELYTRTFDLNPVCSLDLGWHLYAENYDRGTFLVQMRDALRKHGVEETLELPDHLPSVLRLLSRMEDTTARQLVVTSVLPAMKKMLAGFSDHDNPYFSLLRVVESTLTARFPQGVESHG